MVTIPYVKIIEWDVKPQRNKPENPQIKPTTNKEVNIYTHSNLSLILVNHRDIQDTVAHFFGEKKSLQFYLIPKLTLIICPIFLYFRPAIQKCTSRKITT